MTSPRAATARRFLMCRPTYFAVDYVINPWMDPSVPTDNGLAVRQWTTLRDTYLELGHTVEEIEPIPGLPDMVFAANGATVIDGIAYGAQFRHPERAAEAPAYLNWLDGAGFDSHDAKQVNEGEGDLLLTERFLLAGTGFRTDHAAHAEAQELFGRPVITLQLVDPRFYHLDTALAVLGDTVAYLPRGVQPGQREDRSAALPRRGRGGARRRRVARPQRGLATGATSCCRCRRPAWPRSSRRAASPRFRLTSLSC